MGFTNLVTLIQKLLTAMVSYIGVDFILWPILPPWKLVLEVRLARGLKSFLFTFIFFT